jgi:uncharacterized cofD-like protein
MNRPHITIIGGGTGTSVVLSGLKHTQPCELTAIVVVSDSGGSTGRLRDEFGFLPVGDLRQCLAALAKGDHQEDIRSLLLYRFTKGEGLKGHNLGNLILTALEDIKSTPGKAIEAASCIFSTFGAVYPITEQAVDLVIEYRDGTIKIGEDTLDDQRLGGLKIRQVKLSPRASIYPQAKQALLTSDMLILGPGDLYASLLPNTLVRGFKTTLKKARAPFVYIVNLMTHYSQTHEMTAADHIREVTKYCGRKPDIVILNNQPVPKAILSAYAKQKEYPVIDDLDNDHGYQVIRDKLLSKIEVKQSKVDTVTRSLLRHDSHKLANVILSLLNKGS